MPDSKNSSTLTGMETTRSMKRKAKMLSRCFINILKCWRMCKKTKKDTKNPEKDMI